METKNQFGEKMIADANIDTLNTGFIVSASQMLIDEVKVIEGISLNKLMKFSEVKDALERLNFISTSILGVFKVMVDKTEDTAPERLVDILSWIQSNCSTISLSLIGDINKFNEQFPQDYSSKLEVLLEETSKNFKDIASLMEKVIPERQVNFDIAEMESILAEEEIEIPETSSREQMIAFLKA